MALASPLPSTSLPSFPTTAQCLSNLQQYAQNRQKLLTNFNAGGPFETFLEMIAVTFGSDASSQPGVTQQGAYELLNQVRTANYIVTAQGIFLDLKAADVGVYRKQATTASGYVVFTLPQAATSPFVIPAGTQVAAPPTDPTLPPVVYTTTQTMTIQTGQQVSPNVPVVSASAGSAGNQPAFVVTTVISSLGSIAVTNPTPISGGADEEGDDTPNGGLRLRALNAVPNASQCTPPALAEAPLKYTGITSSSYLDYTDVNATIVIGGTPHTGDVLTVVIDGVTVTYTVVGGDTTTALIATHLNTAITNAHIPNVTNVVSASTITLTSYQSLSISGTVSGTGATTTMAANLNLIGIGTTLAHGVIFIDDGNGTVLVTAPASVAQFGADLTSGLYRAGGAIIKYVPAVLANMTCVIYVEVQASAINTGVTEASLIAAVQTALLAYGASLQMGQPAKLADLVEVARAVPGISNVMIVSGTDNLMNPYYPPTLGVPSPPSGSPISPASADIIPPANWLLRFANAAAITVNIAGTPTPFN